MYAKKIGFEAYGLSGFLPIFAKKSYKPKTIK